MLILLQTTRLCQHTNKSLDVVITSLTNDLSHVDRWCQHNHMSINSDKSNVMFNSSRQNRQFLQSNPEIPYLDSVIKSCSTAKLLGVTVNNSLSWNDHIETFIKKKCNTYLYTLLGCNRLATLYRYIDHFSIDDIAIYQKNQRRPGNLQCNCKNRTFITCLVTKIHCVCKQ